MRQPASATGSGPRPLDASGARSAPYCAAFNNSCGCSMRNPAAKLWYRSSTPSSCSPSKRPLALCPAAKTTADAGTKDASESSPSSSSSSNRRHLFGSSACTPTARDAAVSLVRRGFEHDPLRRLTEPQIHAPRREVSPRVSEDAHQAIRAEVGFAGDENLARRAECDERSEDRTHVVRVASDAGGEFTVGPRTRAPLAVTQVAVRIEHAASEQRADVPPAGFHRLAALQHGRRDALLRERERGEQTRGAQTDDTRARRRRG